MGKISAILTLFFVLIFSGCEDEKPKAVLDLNETAPSDVPIAAPDANISIDENLPPLPVVEGKS